MKPQPDEIWTRPADHTIALITNDIGAKSYSRDIAIATPYGIVAGRSYASGKTWLELVHKGEAITYIWDTSYSTRYMMTLAKRMVSEITGQPQP